MLDHRLHDFNRHLAVLLDLVLKAEDGALAQPLSIEVLEDLRILVLLNRFPQLHQCLLAEISVLLGEHVQETVVALLEFDVRLGLNDFVLHVSGLR